MKRSDFIYEYYYLIEEFLNVQFEYLIGNSNYEKILETQQKCISHLEMSQDRESSFQNIVDLHLKQLKGVSDIVVGFPDLKFDYDSTSKEEALDILNSFRGDSFERGLPELPIYRGDFDPRGLNIEIDPRKWIEFHDLKLKKEIDAKDLKNLLFSIDKDTLSCNQEWSYEFLECPAENNSFAGFFMVMLPISKIFKIGHRPTNSLFSLSTLAHEIGHTTTVQEKSLESRFMSIENQKVPFYEDQEYDSYKYEKLLVDNCEHILKSLDNLELNGSVGELLFKRKSIQFNLHLLSHFLAKKFFDGESLESIERFFNKMIILINPEFNFIEDRLQWVHYAKLNQPFASYPYLYAYRKHFMV